MFSPAEIKDNAGVALNAEELLLKLNEYQTLLSRGIMSTVWMTSEPKVMHKKSYRTFCIKCKKIQDFTWPALDGMEAPEETEGWGKIQGKYLELRGICRECLKNEKRAVTK